MKFRARPFDPFPISPSGVLSHPAGFRYNPAPLSTESNTKENLMAKVLEGPGMGLMKKWGILVPNYAVVTSVNELSKLSQVNEWMKKAKLVAKAHEALGSRFKLGLVKVGLDLNGAVAATKEMIGRQVGSITVSQVIVSEMVAHKEEYYCAVKSTREGSEILSPIAAVSKWSPIGSV